MPLYSDPYSYVWNQWTTTTTGSVTIQPSVSYQQVTTATGMVVPVDYLREQERRHREMLQAREARLAEERERERQLRERRRAAQQRYATSRARAMELLQMLIGDAIHDESVAVTGSDGRPYEVRMMDDSYMGNIWVMHEGRRAASLCVHLREYDTQGEAIPAADHWVGQILALRTDAVGFVSHANLQTGHLPDDLSEAVRDYREANPGHRGGHLALPPRRLRVGNIIAA